MTDPRKKMERNLAALGHTRRPLTRREFLGQGLVAGAGMVTMPSLLSTLLGPRRAAAQTIPNCGTASGGAGRIPFMCFDLAGGANVAGSNVMVGGQGGQLDFLAQEAYVKLGLPTILHPQNPDQLDASLGLTFHSDSAFLRGIVARTSITTRDKLNGVVFCAKSENDTSNNPHNPTYGIARSGSDGELVTLVGSRSNESGGRSMVPPAMFDAALRPTRISQSRDATGLVDTGKLVQILDQDDAREVMLASEAISRRKLEKMTEDAAIEELVECGYIQSTTLISQFGDPNLLDPFADANIVGPIFSAQEIDGSQKYERTVSVLKLVANGFAGAGTVELGGYDYHDSTRAKGEDRDFEAGECIGACFEYAAAIGQQLAIYVFSDGSVASDGQLDESTAGRGKGRWRGDNSSTAASFMMVYDPNAVTRPQLTTAGSQIGHFRLNGSVETSANRTSNNPAVLAEAIVLNYLALHDEVGRLDSVIPGHSLGTTAEIDSLVAFQPIRTSA